MRIPCGEVVSRGTVEQRPARRPEQALPTDLNKFYWHMLTSHVHEFYREQAAVIFDVTEAAFSPLIFDSVLVPG